MGLSKICGKNFNKTMKRKYPMKRKYLDKTHHLKEKQRRHRKPILSSSLKPCSHLTFAFAFASTSPSKFNIRDL